ncbi:hypothetical protein ACT6QG_15225 [Xanthobacter sp. TB0136]|uniref:hypothetical protein n=1 Tax=Xanthobacter sp. TB0136 TaxID=3459177 RepID=UPI004039751A
MPERAGLSFPRLIGAGAALMAFSLAGAAGAGAGVGQNQLTLTSQGVETDEAGAFISVSVQNATPKEQNEVVVRCVFLNRGRTLGSASTPLYAIPSGKTGYGQVRLLGATSATSAACTITSAE